MSIVIEENQIPYQSFARRLFSSSREQQIVPFLGAGVSLSGVDSRQELKEKSHFPDQETMENIFSELNIDGKARVFMEMAILMACLLQITQQNFPNPPDEKLLDHLQRENFPPSAGELAKLFSHLSQYTAFKGIVEDLRTILPSQSMSSTAREQIEMLKLLSSVTGIANPPDALASIASYYETRIGRTYLWDDLSAVISKKNETTGIHCLIAEAAKYSIESERSVDYLVITTNYDCLMEKALDDLGVPYIVVITKRSDQKVVVRLSEQIPDSRKFEEELSGMYPDKFMFRKPRNLGSLVVLYKIHGCLNHKLTIRDDAVIISDSDYVNYISQMGSSGGTIPVYVNDLMREKPFLFLGYSLKDWNVRSIFESIRKKRNPDVNQPDFSVMKYVGEYEALFFLRNNVTILQTDLNTYVKGLLPVAPEHIVLDMMPFLPDSLVMETLPYLPEGLIKEVLPRLSLPLINSLLPLLPETLRDEVAKYGT
jgi:hypothetical protein